MIVPTTMHVEPVQVGDQWWLDVTIGPHKLKQRGPFKDADTAKTAADRFIQNWQPKIPPQTPATLPVDGDRRHEFIADMARFAEGTLSRDWVKRKWRFDDATWEKLGNDDALVEEIENAKIRRIRDGSNKREKAQLHVVQAPDVLNQVMLNAASDRHKIDAAKALDDLADNGPESTSAMQPMTITFNLGDRVEKYEWNNGTRVDSITPKPNADTAPQELLPIIAANKTEGGGSGGEPL